MPQAERNYASPSKAELERKVFLQHCQLIKLNTIVDGLERANGHLLAEIAELRKEHHDSD